MIGGEERVLILEDVCQCQWALILPCGNLLLQFFKPARACCLRRVSSLQPAVGLGRIV